MIEAAGFVGVRFSVRRWDAFGGSPSESDAAKFGTEGVAIYAVKPDGREARGRRAGAGGAERGGTE